ncbi:MAG: hypothetical protein ACXVJO_11370 [Thermoanaerobaculia bacterium]
MMIRSGRPNWSSASANPIVGGAMAAAAIALAWSCGSVGSGHAQTVRSRYPSPAPIEQYRSKTPAEEIALARSAAPPSISSNAEVLVLGGSGYETAVKGTNGFVCLVERSWDAGFDDPQFWNPHIRGPNCFNEPAARTQLPQFLKRTEWVLSGASRQELIERTRSAFGNHTFTTPEPGALSYMLSKRGYVSDDAAGPWLPHMMLYVPHGQAAAWGAGAEGSPIIGHDDSDIESTVLVIPVRRWSDGAPASPEVVLR